MDSERTMDKNGGERCPVCSGSLLHKALEVQTDKLYSILVCGGCHLAFAAPRPTPEELDRFYTQTYFSREPTKRLGYMDYRSMGEVNARRSWKELKRFANLPSLAPRKRILDVGCATGGFLDEAQKEGWECVGVDLSEHAITIARDEWKLNVFHGDIFHPALQECDFGVLTMFHVLEHMIDPVTALKRAVSLLMPGGLLFIELPNWNSAGRIIRKAAWAQLRPPEHINFFTPRSLQQVVKQVGLDVLISISYYEPRPPMTGLQSARSMVVAAAVKSAARVGLGGYVRLLAQKRA